MTTHEADPMPARPPRRSKALARWLILTLVAALACTVGCEPSADDGDEPAATTTSTTRNEGPASANDESPAEANDESRAEANDESPAEANDESRAQANDESPAEASDESRAEADGEDIVAVLEANEGKFGPGPAGLGRSQVAPSAGPDASDTDARDDRSLEAKVADTPPVVGDGLDPREVHKEVRRHRLELRHCYTNHLAKHRDLAGTVVVEWAIEANGAVGEIAVVDQTIAVDAVGECVVRSMRRWTFPAPSAGAPVTVRQSFSFALE